MAAANEVYARDEQTSNEGFRAGRRGWAIKGDLLLRFTESSVTAMRLWPKPAAWQKTFEEPVWRSVRPYFDISMGEAEQAARRAKRFVGHSCPDLAQGQMLLPGVEAPLAWRYLERRLRERALCRAAVAAIPLDVRTALGPFTERQWSLLSFCARCPGGLDLLHSTPALAFMLANSWVFRRPVKRPLRSARALLRKKQREHLRWLGFPRASEQALRILRKVAPASCTVENLLYLRTALGLEANWKVLSHAGRINRGVVRIVSDPRLAPLVGPTLLDEVGTDQREDIRVPTAYDLFRYRDLHQLLERPGAPNPVKSRSQLRQRLDELEFEHRMLVEHRELEALTFPPPPLKGTAAIQPIATPRELVREGVSQHHCIASYAGEIASGGAYAYRVIIGDERATLLIRNQGPHHDAKWRMADCRRASNGEPTAQLLVSVEQWLVEVGGMPRLPHREPHRPEPAYAYARGGAAYGDLQDDEVPF